MKGYYFITDTSLSIHGDLSDVKAACRAGVEIIQYRQKNALTKDLYHEALELKKLCKNSIFIINDRLDIALAVQADGIHIGQDDLPLPVVRKILGGKAVVGVTVHNVEEAVLAQKQGATYLAVSPVFETSTKSDAGRPCGVELIREVKKVCRLSITAIGGISLDNTAEVIMAGADMVCAVSAVVKSRDVEKQIKRFQEMYHDAVGMR